MPTTALPAPSAWSLASGLEARGDRIQLKRFGLRDDFSGGFDASVWGTTDSGDGIVGAPRNGEIKIATPASADAAVLYYKGTLSRSQDWRLKWRFRVSAVGSSRNHVVGLWQDTAPPQPIGGTVENQIFFVEQFNTGEFRVQYWDTGGTRYYWDPANDVWTTTSTSFSGTLGAYYRVVLASDGSNFWLELYDANDALITATTKVPWSDVRSPAGDTYAYFHEPYKNAYAATMHGDEFTYGLPDDGYNGGCLSTAPVAESQWVAIAHDQVDDVVLVENPEGQAGTLKYQYALNGGAYNGTWLTLAELRSALQGASITDHAQSLRLKAQFNSDGTQQAVLAGLGTYVDVSGLSSPEGAVYQLPLQALRLRTGYEVIQI